MPEAQVDGQSVRRSLHRRVLFFSSFTGLQTLVQLWLGACGRSASPVGYRDGWGKSEGYADGERLLLEGDE